MVSIIMIWVTIILWLLIGCVTMAGFMTAFPDHNSMDKLYTTVEFSISPGGMSTKGLITTA